MPTPSTAPVACWPPSGLTGQRLYRVRSQRPKREYTQLMKQLAAHYSQAEKIRLVQDNRNIHAQSTFDGYLPARYPGPALG